MILEKQRSAWKSELKRFLLAQAKEEDLTTISLTDHHEEIFWEEDDEKVEFTFRGELYDLVRIVEKEGKTWLCAVNDKTEMKILDKLHDLYAGSNGLQNNKSVPAFFMPLFILEPLASLSCHSTFIQQYFIEFSSPIEDHEGTMISPPPQA